MEENYAVCDEALGDVRISDEVVANIAVIAAGEIEGVSYVVGDSKPNEFKNFVGIKNYSTKDLRVEVCDRIVSVDMAIAVKYGFSLPAVGKAVQERVRTSIESMTGLEVSDINVRIACVDLK
ncbi:MAG: Asp23/Gls24 family envelope stress response protein [Lachnospiraceae bacterium]|nr:Asp23/Gls24 family envelope stress response protein [Lachnospiraceae bacterium]